jgi:plastocyanin
MWTLRRSAPRPSSRTAWRRSSAAGLAALALTSASALPAASAAPRAERGVGRATVGVTVANFAFTPAKVTVATGGTVRWTFPESMAHTTESNAGFWSSPHEMGGATYAHTFPTAGTFGYHCAIHTFMHGMVRVPLTATVSATSGWRLRWAAAMPTGYSVDVQVRKPHTTKWVSLRTGTRALGTHFDPAKAGTYGLRARTHRNAHVSSWSPVRTIHKL